MTANVRVLMSLGVVLLVAACASETSPALLSRLSSAGPDQPVQCDGRCKTEWERAQIWLTQHSNWKLQLVTDVSLQTFNPPNQDVSYGFVVSKVPQGSGYVIAMGLQCGNLIGCDPKPSDIRRAFYHYVTTGQDLLVGAGYLGTIR